MKVMVLLFVANMRRWCNASRYARCQPPLLMTLVLLFPMGTYGAERPAKAAEQPSIYDFLNASHDYWSEKIAGFAGALDRFLGNETSFQEANESVVQIDLNEVANQGGNRHTTLVGRANLALPLAEKRLHLLVETDPEKVATGAAAKDRPVLPSDVASPQSYAAAVRYQKVEKNVWHFSAGAGIKLRASFAPFVRARGSVSIPFSKWRLRLEQNLYWFNTIGAGENTQMDIEHLLSDSVLFRATSNITWLHDKQAYDLSEDISINHKIDERRALVYQVSAIGVSQPQWQVTDYVVLVRYRRRLHRDWLFVEVSPQLHYPKERHYHIDPLLILRLELLFGGKRAVAQPVPPIDSNTQ
jgi:hypothetical protein